MGNKQFKNSTIIDTAPSRNNPFLYVIIQSKSKMYFLCCIQVKSSNQLGKTNLDLSNVQKTVIDGIPKKMQLDWKEHYIYMLVTGKQGTQLAIYETNKLTVHKQISNVPNECESFQVVSPFYNEYFSMQMFMLRKCYSNMLYRLQVDTFLINESEEPSLIPKSESVFVISSCNRLETDSICFTQI